MQFSVLMSIYNGDSPSYLAEALNSLYSQTLLPNEIVLIIDGPINSDLKAVLQFFSNKKELPILQVPLKKNMGLGLALAEGIKYCKYDLIARMDSDDICKENRFQIQIEYLMNNPEISVLGSWIDEFYNDRTNIVSKRKVPKEHVEIMKYMKGRCPLNHPTVIFRKKEVLKAGNYKPYFLKEDIYLWLRLAKSGVKFSNIQESLLLFRTTKGMYKRRGGWKYAKSELNILVYRYQIGFISFMELILYCSLTLPVRLAPSFLRGFIYSKLLR